MIKTRKRKLSVLLVLTLLMTMLVGVGTASASAAEFQTLTSPIVKADGGTYDLGTVKVVIENVEALPPEGAWLTISLPSGCEYTYQYAVGTEVTSTANLSVSEAVKTAVDTFEILVTSNYTSGDLDSEGHLIIRFHGVKVKAGSDYIEALFLSNSSVFGLMNKATIAIIGSGATNVLAKSVKTISGTDGEIDTLIIAETVGRVFKYGESIAITLPEGFSWGDSDVEAVLGDWSLTGASFPYAINGRVLTITLEDDPTSSLLPTIEAGRINIGSAAGGYFAIQAADTAADGEVYVTIASDRGAVDEQSVLVAYYIRNVGDINGNGAIDSEDSVLVLSAYAGLATLTESQMKAADMNQDGQVNSGDATLILRADLAAK